jgi:hypothetical protein
VIIKLLETISATFMLTAAAYAAGVVQSKELYRELGVEPEIISIDLQKALYDGGLLVFSELAHDFFEVVPYLVLVLVVCAIACFFGVVRSWVLSHTSAIIHCSSVFGYVVLLWLIYDVTVSSFAQGRDLGAKLAEHLKSECTVTTVQYEGGKSKGLCAIGRTADLLWFYDPKSRNAVSFGKDKIIQVVGGE